MTLRDSLFEIQARLNSARLREQVSTEVWASRGSNQNLLLSIQAQERQQLVFGGAVSEVEPRAMQLGLTEVGRSPTTASTASTTAMCLGNQVRADL